MELKSRQEAADYIGISLTTFKKEVQKHLPCIRIGRRVCFDLKDLNTYLESLKTGAGYGTSK